MMKFGSLFVICLSGALLIALPVEAQEENSSGVIRVTAVGVGHDTDEALKDAFKNAIRRAVGVYVISETTLNNDDIDEKIYANSDGTIDSHTVLDTKTLPNNLVQITIKADVRKGMIQRVVASQGKTTEINRSSILQMSNHFDAEEEAVKSLDYIFRDFPACLLKVEMLGRPIIDESRKRTSETLPMLQSVRVSIDYKKYQQFITQLISLFDKMGYKKGRRSVVQEDIYGRKSYGDSFHLCLCILQLRNPAVRPKKLQDFTIQSYKISGECMRKLAEYATRGIIMQYEVVDADDKVLGIRELENYPGAMIVGNRVSIRYGEEGFRCYGYPFYNSPESSETLRSPLTSLIYPLAGLNEWDEHESWQNLSFRFSKKMTIEFEVNRPLFEKAGNARFKASIRNKQESVNEAP